MVIKLILAAAIVGGFLGVLTASRVFSSRPELATPGLAIALVALGVVILMVAAWRYRVLRSRR